MTRHLGIRGTKRASSARSLHRSETSTWVMFVLAAFTVLAVVMGALSVVKEVSDARCFRGSIAARTVIADREDALRAQSDKVTDDLGTAESKALDLPDSTARRVAFRAAIDAAATARAHIQAERDADAKQRATSPLRTKC